jgi:glucosamine--fructose-6-phosphate aminotransferase (isomerizing)
MTLVALWFAHRKSYKQTKVQRASLTKELKFLSGNLEKTLEGSLEFSKHVSHTILKHHKHLYLLGSGLAEITAKEGALKIKELTYLHCQAMNLSANISNGFYSYVQAHPTPLIFVILERSQDVASDLEVMRVMQQRIDGLKGKAIVITDVKDREVREFLENFTGDSRLVHQIPSSGYLSTLLAVVPL